MYTPLLNLLLLMVFFRYIPNSYIDNCTMEPTGTNLWSHLENIISNKTSSSDLIQTSLILMGGVAERLIQQCISGSKDLDETIQLLASWTRHCLVYSKTDIVCRLTSLI